MDRWRNKVAIVTGASGGIGAAIAEKLVEENIIVVGFARRKEKLEQLAAKLNNNKTLFHYRIVDITKEEDILNAIKWTVDNLGPVHILVNNAGIGVAQSLCEGETKYWKTVLDTNVLGLFIATREVLKNMKENEVDGHIININSIAGHIAVPLSMYTASKFAVTSITESIRKELVNSGSKVKVTSISPGYVETEIFVNSYLLCDVPLPKEVMRKGLKSEDVANAVLYTIGTPPHVQVHEITIKLLN